jgi:hypothetical protein
VISARSAVPQGRHLHHPGNVGDRTAHASEHNKSSYDSHIRTSVLPRTWAMLIMSTTSARWERDGAIPALVRIWADETWVKAAHPRWCQQPSSDAAFGASQQMPDSMQWRRASTRQRLCSLHCSRQLQIVQEELTWMKQSLRQYHLSQQTFDLRARSMVPKF